MIALKDCPAIVYVSRTKRTKELADKLTSDGFPARPFNGKMDPNDKIANQEAFIRNEIKVIVATSAFGMGVDKKDVKLVVHYDISSSLEDYVQEAGRAGRDPFLQAECYVLYNDNDLDKHFILLNQTKLSISEIQQVWKAVKDLTRLRPRICCSPLEIARQAGWDDSVSDIETRVKTAVSALESAGYVKRGRNMPHVYATSILAKDMREASFRIDQSTLFSDDERITAKRIIKSLISSRSIAAAEGDDAESRVDYLADTLGMTKEEIITAVNLMRQDGLLADSMDMSAYILASDTENRSKLILDRFAKLERFLLSQFSEDGCNLNLKELNEAAQAEGIAASSVKNLRTLLYYHTVKNYIRKSEDRESRTVKLFPAMDVFRLMDKYNRRIDICHFIAESKYIVVAAGPGSGKTRVLVHKLAALLLLEDVKHEQLLMLTFSRAAATEFKKRLMALVGNAADFVEIKTFHSYCFDLSGKIGNLEGIDDVVKNAGDMIRHGEVEPNKITKSVLVIDEAQDMDENEFNLIRALIQNNEDMRVIAVGDDDQNIYQFRGSNSKYLRSLIEDYGAVLYEMVENYRSRPNIVALGNTFAGRIENRMKSVPVEAVQREEGIVHITHHICENMAEAVVRQIRETRGNDKACVLTNTNDEALQILGLLNEQSCRAKLIQSLDGFRLYNLAEIRFLLKSIDRELRSPVIPDELWRKAKKRLSDVYADSMCLEICRNMMRDFERVYPTKYRSDLEEFIKESNYEDFYTDEKETILISTIHKAKGREFDTVYMLLNGCFMQTDENLRKLYVGMTRARNALYIHCNSDLFSADPVSGITYTEDSTVYGEPNELTLQLTHKDVVLDFFRDKKDFILSLHSGAALSVKEPYLCADINGQNVRVAKFSKICRESLENLRSRGYSVYSASVRFVVAWKGEADEDETAVLLPDLSLRRC